MRSLDDSQRRRMLRLSAVLCSIPLCLAPVAGRSSFEIAKEQAAFDARFAAPQIDAAWADEPVSIARDPFVPDTAAHNVSSSAVRAAGTQAGGPNVTAVVTGPSPRALIDDGRRVRVIAVGDVLRSSRVVRIDRFGVHLQNGTLLRVAEAGS